MVTPLLFLYVDLVMHILVITFNKVQSIFIYFFISVFNIEISLFRPNNISHENIVQPVRIGAVEFLRHFYNVEIRLTMINILQYTLRDKLIYGASNKYYMYIH